MATEKPTWSKDDLKTSKSRSSDDPSTDATSTSSRTASAARSGATTTDADTEHFNDLIKEGWTALTIKAGETRSVHDVEYDPATFKMELSDEHFGAGGAPLEPDAEVPEVEIEEDHKGGWLATDHSVDFDLVSMYKLVGEIRE